MQNRNEIELYPLRFSPLLVEKVWGGTQIAERFQQEEPAGRMIGEAWVVWDQLVVENGTLRGKRLADLVRDDPDPILGHRLVARQQHVFPLLVKILDARETLSVQVHPGDSYARAQEGEPFGKAEVWYILDVEPQSSLIHGLNRSLTRAAAQHAIETGKLREVLEHVHVSPGDVIMNMPGTIHALGEGLLLYELQQSSDLTYRLYDWDRRDPNRPLHIEKSLDVAHLEPYAAHKVEPVEMAEEGGTRALLCACQYFAAELLTVRSRLSELPAGACFHVLTVLQGTGRLLYGARSEHEVELRAGESLLVPAAVQAYELQAAGESLQVIKAYVPDLLNDILVPLRQRGIPEAKIVQLGGEPKYSDLGPLAQASEPPLP
jgi:mannose-6-phosphate isomerase